MPIGIIFLVFSGQVQEYSFDYSSCLNDASLDRWSVAPAALGSIPFEWRRFKQVPPYARESSEDLQPAYVEASNLCELQFTITKDIAGPVFQYYKLKNFYQNQRLYVKSVDWRQLKGDAKSYDELSDCAPLIGPGETNAAGGQLVYYPCGLIANSMFNDTLGSLVAMDGNLRKQMYNFPPKDIAWPAEKERYGTSTYSIEQVRPPPFWVKSRKWVNSDGTYKRLPDLAGDERFQNWMKVAGLPVFRKLYGKHEGNLPAGTYTILISSTYEVQSYGAKKVLVISNTSWMGGKNSFLGWAYIAAGGVFLFLAVAFLIRHLLAPRRLGDVSYLSWSTESINE